MTISSRDSSERTEETRIITVEHVPSDSVSLLLDTGSLLELPDGASYHARSGRANLDVKRGKTPGTIVVHASCDSLQRLVEYYERQAAGYKAALDERATRTEVERKPPCGWRAFILTLIAGLFSGIVITTRTKK